MWQSIEETSFFDEIEDIWDEIAHISRKRAHWTEMWALGFIFKYQKSTLQCPRKSVSRRVWTLLVSETLMKPYFLMKKYPFNVWLGKKSIWKNVAWETRIGKTDDIYGNHGIWCQKIINIQAGEDAFADA